MGTAEPVRLLEWDSDFFSLRIGSIIAPGLDPETLPHIDFWCNDNRIDCLYFLTDCADSGSIRRAESSGFHLVDLRITLDLKIVSTSTAWMSGSPLIRLSASQDIAPLRRIAAANHRDSRFYRDGRFPKERCDELYATWIEKSCNGYADVVLVADQGEGAVGYTSCHLKGDGTGSIGLVGVSGKCQGAGLGKVLIAESLAWFAANEVSRVTVVTQGINIGAQRLYQKNGFMTKSIELWYHRWSSAPHWGTL